MTASSGVSERRPVIVAIAKRYGGVDVRVEQLARGLMARGRPHLVVVLRGSEIERRLRAAGADVAAIDRNRQSPLIARDLLALAAGRPSLLDAHNVQSQVWAAWASALHGDLPLHVTVHSDYRKEHAGRPGPRSALYPLALRAASARGARFTAVSPAVERSLHRLGVPGERIMLIENAAAAPAVDPTAPSPWPQWPDDAVVVCAVGRLEAVKGHIDLVRALALVADELPTLRVAIVGEGRERAAIEAEIDRAGLADRVLITGFRRDVPTLLAHADALCMPSLSEGLPFALLEAAAAGLPVIASRVGGMAELLEHDRTAHLVPPGDPRALAEGLRRLVLQPEAARETGRALQRLVADRFAVDHMVDETLRSYDAAVAGSDAGSTGPHGLRRALRNSPTLYRMARRVRVLGRYALRRPHEPDFAVFASLPPRPGIFLDIGANSGQSALSFRLFDRRTPILSIEPNRALAGDLRLVARIIGGFRYALCAAGPENATVRLYLPRVGRVVISGEASLDPDSAANLWSGATPDLVPIEVPMRRLDDWGLTPAYVKIDVEGTAGGVVAGLIETIERHRPLLMVEGGGEDDAAWQQLVSRGYRPMAWRSGALGEWSPDALNVIYLPPDNGHIDGPAASGGDDVAGVERGAER